MGNAQSSHRSRSHNKLAKPRTSSHGALRGQKPESNESSLASRYAQLSAKDRQQIKSQLLSPLETEFENSLTETDSKLLVVEDVAAPASATTASVHLGWSSSSRTNSRTNSMSFFGSKGGSSSKLNSRAGSKVSLHEGTDVETAARILDDVKGNASPEDLAALQLALQSSPPSPSPHSSSTADQGVNRRHSSALNLTRSSSSLIRRRSLVATPGLATRNSPADKNRRTWNSWRTPHLDPQEEAKWHAEMAAVNPPTALAALDLAEERSRSPSPRALTPGDRQYSQLGSLQLGTLRIANGEPSPAPSKAFASLSKDTDYFSQTDVEDAPIMMKTTKRRAHGRSKSDAVPSTPPLYRKLRLSTSIRKSKTMSRCDSPQKSDSSATPAPAPKTEPLPLQFEDEYDDEPEPVRRWRVTNKSAETLATLASQYQANAAEETSHTQPDVDEGFVSDEDHDAQEEACRIIDQSLFGSPLTTIHSMPLSNVSTTTLNAKLSILNMSTRDAAVPTTGLPEPDGKPALIIHSPELDGKAIRPAAKKGDSGYSSAGSFAAVQRQAMREGSPTLFEEPSPQEDVPQTSTPGHPYVVPNDVTPQMAEQPGSDSQHATHRPASLQIPSSGNQITPGQLAGVESPRTPMSAHSKASVDSKASVFKRLQKRRPSQPELPAVEPANPTLELAIPEVPQETRRKFMTRMAEVPSMDCLTQTYPTTDHIHSEESRGTSSMSTSFKSTTVAPEVIAKGIQRSATAQPEKSEWKRWSFREDHKPVQADEPRGRHHSRSTTDRPQTPSSRGLRRSLSLFRSKSKSKADKHASVENESNELPMLVDFGTIGTALGRSPYDAAIDAAFRPSPANPMAPHQMGNATPLPRARSLVHMDAQTASEYARARSKDRSQARPPMPQRPKSFHQASYSSSHDTTGYGPPRPQSSYYDNDIPPVPTLHHTYRTNTPLPTTTIQTAPSTTANRPPMVRARSTGRGPVVAQIVNRYDQYGDWDPPPVQWEARSRTPVSSGGGHHAQQPQRRRNYSVGPPLPQQQRSSFDAPPRQRSFSSSASSQRLPYQPQPQYDAYHPPYQHQQHQVPQPQTSASAYGRHSLPSQISYRDFVENNGGGGAFTKSLTTTTTTAPPASAGSGRGRQLHSYNTGLQRRFGTRYYAGAAGGGGGVYQQKV